MEPDPSLTIATMVVALVITFSTILVRYKVMTRISKKTTSQWFKNPFKNVNIIIIKISLSYTMLQKMFFDIKRFPLLMFPLFSVGLYMTPMLWLFLIGNPSIQKHAVKSILSSLSWGLPPRGRQFPSAAAGHATSAQIDRYRPSDLLADGGWELFLSV